MKKIFTVLSVIVALGVGAASGYSVGIDRGREKAQAEAQVNLVFCRDDAKTCPDGSTVGRKAPNCEFADCPATGDTRGILEGTVILNSQPYQTSLEVTTQDGKGVFQKFESDQNGRFRVFLAPGYYSVRQADGANDTLNPHCSGNIPFRIQTGQTTKTDVGCDVVLDGNWPT